MRIVQKSFFRVLLLSNVLFEKHLDMKQKNIKIQVHNKLTESLYDCLTGIFIYIFWAVFYLSLTLVGMNHILGIIII